MRETYAVAMLVSAKRDAQNFQPWISFQWCFMESFTESVLCQVASLLLVHFGRRAICGYEYLPLYRKYTDGLLNSFPLLLTVNLRNKSTKHRLFNL